MKRVLFVCRANIRRSPMAAAVFNALAGDGDLAYRAGSAGVAALTGEPIAPNAREALEELGVNAGDHRARQVSGPMLEEADLVLAMTPRQAAELSRLAGGPDVPVYTLPEYSGASGEAEVPDPYGLPLTTYRACARQILGYVELVVDRLGER